ncbi:MAG: ferrous iron transport protein A [Candidatus Bathyarchaeota archaeon]|nr:FeoA family protein [Candidatus Bathyarchaeum tardum]WGM89388.1 MAG: FeoA family protein [Candidatus Bathyarchaeum tardum]WNZ28332.1 MAG: ferrous iron transport protein A [Candidatus Bathyarchaeota archaeon]
MMEVPLALLSVGAKGKITRIRGGKELIRRLNDMGLTRDSEVTVICSHSCPNPDRGGPLVVEIKDSRVAFGRGVATKIMVQEVDN